jgi:hypothetical protein
VNSLRFWTLTGFLGDPDARNLHPELLAILSKTGSGYLHRRQISYSYCRLSLPKGFLLVPSPQFYSRINLTIIKDIF